MFDRQTAARRVWIVASVLLLGACNWPGEPDPGEPVRCAGLAGVLCPEGQVCLDDPSDDCDPNNGGADCGGLCTIVIDPCAGVRCKAGTHCTAPADAPVCVPDEVIDPCASVRCKAGTHCTAPADEPVCVPDEERVFCGGIAAFQCPGLGQCADDPDDGCDVLQGGADCGGYCTCTALAKCVEGSYFDRSPAVCSCVKPEGENPCNLIDCRPGAYCIVHDGAGVCVSDGTLSCGAAQCAEGTTCCNDSCGVCTPPGVFCTQQACL